MAAKTSLLNEFAFFQTLSRSFKFAENVKCRRISLELIHQVPNSSLNRERKIHAVLHFISLVPSRSFHQMLEDSSGI